MTERLNGTELNCPSPHGLATDSTCPHCCSWKPSVDISSNALCWRMTKHFLSCVSKFSKASFFDGLRIELIGLLVHHICTLFFFFPDVYLIFFPLSNQITFARSCIQSLLWLDDYVLDIFTFQGGRNHVWRSQQTCNFREEEVPRGKRVRTKGMETLGTRRGSRGHKASGGLSARRESFVGRASCRTLQGLSTQGGRWCPLGTPIGPMPCSHREGPPARRGDLGPHNAQLTENPPAPAQSCVNYQYICSEGRFCWRRCLNFPELLLFPGYFVDGDQVWFRSSLTNTVDDLPSEAL